MFAVEQAQASTDCSGALTHTVYAEPLWRSAWVKSTSIVGDFQPHQLGVDFNRDRDALGVRMLEGVIQCFLGDAVQVVACFPVQRQGRILRGPEIYVGLVT